MSSQELLKEFFIDLQLALGRLLEKFEEKIRVEELKVVAAVDAAYARNLMSLAAVEWDLQENKPIQQSSFVCEPTYPYVPGLLFLREGPPMLRAVKKLSDRWQLLLVDAHGILHPRRMGLAVFLGFLLNKPSLGVAKSLLVGSEVPGKRFGEVEVNREVLGYWFKFERSRKFYASPGYMIEVGQVPKIIEKFGGRYPDPLRYVDKLSKRILGRKEG